MVLIFKLRTDREIEYTGNVPPATVQQLYRPNNCLIYKLHEIINKYDSKHNFTY
jgi:hypothetical protein